MQRLFIATLLTLACALTAQAEIARPETLDETLNLMHKKFLDDPRVTSTNADLEQRYISFRINDGPIQISLPDTIHKTMQEAASDTARQQALEKFINFTIQVSQSVAPEAPLDLTKIYPVIRPTGFGSEPFEDDASEEFHPKGFGTKRFGYEDQEEAQSLPVSLPFAADMSLFFVQDNEQIIQFVTVDDLAQLETDAVDLKAIALKNQQSLAWDLEIGGGDGLYTLSLDGDFETSFMLNDSFWRGVSVGLNSIVAVVAAPNLVLFVNGDIEGAVENLLTLVDPTINEFSSPISTTPLKWRNGVWTPIN